MQLSLWRNLGVPTQNFAPKKRKTGFLVCHPNESFPVNFSPAHEFLATWILYHYDLTHHHLSFSDIPSPLYIRLTLWILDKYWRSNPADVCVLWDLVPDRYKPFPLEHFTRWEGLWCLVPDLEIVYKTAKPRGTKGKLISSNIISTVFTKVHQLRKTMQTDDGEEASQPSSPTAASVSQNFIACAELIPQDWLRRFQYCWWGWRATEEAASTWGETKWACSVAAHRWKLARGDDVKVYHTECILVGRRRKNQPIEILKPLQ